MVKVNQNIKIGLLERILVNWSLPSDFIWHTIKSNLVNDEYSDQSLTERLQGIWCGKIEKYHKLLTMKEKYGGILPEKIKKICKKTPCGYSRLLLTYLRSIDVVEKEIGYPL